MLQIRESYVNATKGHRYGDSDWYEPWTHDKGALYRALVKENGRCTGRVYLDMSADGKAGPIPVGWVFLKRAKYDDCDETYLRETWVEYRHVEDVAA